VTAPTTQPPPGLLGRRHTPEPVATAVEALGGTPPDVVRRRTSPLRRVLPPGPGRWVARFDRSADRAFGRLRGRPAADRLFYSASTLGDFSLLWHLAGTARALRSPGHEREAVRLGASLAGESLLINWGVKSLFRRTRPAWEQQRPLGLRRPRSSSFPSGHATSGFLAATLLAHGRPRTAPLWYSVAAVVATSRVHVRIHHASDVVAGAAIGVVLGRLVTRAWPVPLDAGGAEVPADAVAPDDETLGG
jgi:undecaprenyl-diphosphatase